jgi:peroxiredoxin
VVHCVLAAESVPATPADSLAVPASTPDTAATDSSARQAPDIMLPDLDGVPQRLLAHPGRLLLLVYWSPECPECLHEMPRLARLYARERERGLAVLSVTYPRLREEAAAYAREKSLGFPVLLDAGGHAAKLYHVRITPTIFLVKSGRIVLTHAGFDAKVADPIEPAVEALLR